MPTSSQGMRQRPMSERVRRMRENNAKLLGLSEEQLQTEKEDKFEEIGDNE